MPGATRPEQLFLRPYGDSRRTDYYAEYLRDVSEASTQVRGAKSPPSMVPSGKPSTNPSEAR